MAEKINMAMTTILSTLNWDRTAVIIVRMIRKPYAIVNCFFMAKKLNIASEKAATK